MAIINQNTFHKNKISVEVKTNKDSIRVSSILLNQNVFTETETLLEISPRSTYLAKNNFSEKKKILGKNYTTDSIKINIKDGSYLLPLNAIPPPLRAMKMGFHYEEQ